MNNIAVIGGLGKMGKRHCETLKFLNVNYTIFDIGDGSYNIDYDNYTHFIVATPSITHADVCRELIKNTKSPILVEKPIITDLKDKDLLNNKQLFHGTIRRFDPMFFDILDWCKIRYVEKIVIYKASPRPLNHTSYGSLILDLGIHYIDMLTYMYPEISFSMDGDTIRGKCNNINVCINVLYRDEGGFYDIMSIYTNTEPLHVDFYKRKIVGDGESKSYSYYEPLQNELYAFLNGQTNNSARANLICLGL